MVIKRKNLARFDVMITSQKPFILHFNLYLFLILSLLQRQAFGLVIINNVKYIMVQQQQQLKPNELSHMLLKIV